MSWRRGHRPLLELLSRDHRRRVVAEVEPATGAVTTVAEQTDDAWLEPVVGVPDRAPDGRLLQVLVDADSDTYRLAADGAMLSPAGVQIEDVLGIAEDGALLRVSPDSVRYHLAVLGWDGSWRQLTDGDEVASGTRAGGTVAVTRLTLDAVTPVTTVSPAGGSRSPWAVSPSSRRSSRR